MTNEEEFELFKAFIIPKIEFKKGAFSEYALESNGFGSVVYTCRIGVVISKEEMNEYYNLINKQNNGMDKR